MKIQNNSFDTVRETILWGILGLLKRHHYVGGDFHVSPAQTDGGFIAFCDFHPLTMEHLIHEKRWNTDIICDSGNKALILEIKGDISKLADATVFIHRLCFSLEETKRMMSRSYTLKSWITFQEKQAPSGKNMFAQAPVFSFSGDLNEVVQSARPFLFKLEEKRVPLKASWA